VKTLSQFFGKVRLIVANFSLKERAIFITSVMLFCIGVFGGLVAISNRHTSIVPIFGGTYREGIVGSPRFINPVLANSDADHDVSALVYNGLVRSDATGDLIPDLAASWTISPDGKTYTFILKPNLKFQDGKALTSADVAFTVTKIQDPTLKSPLAVAWDGVGVTTPDASTVVFSLQKPYAGFLNQLTIGILPSHIWSSVADANWVQSEYNTEPIGSGPFGVTSVSRSSVGVPQTYSLKAFQGFALGRPLIKHFKIVSFANQDDASAAFKSGSISGLAAVDPSAIASLKSHGTQVLTTQLPRVFGMFFNPSQNPIFADQTVVKAVNLGVDKNALIQSVFDGYAVPLDGPLPQFVDTGTSDIATKQLLAEKMLDADGWKVNPTTGIREKTTTSGKTKTTTPLEFSLSTANTPELEDSAQLIAEQLQKIGVQVDVKIFEIGNLNENVIRPRAFDALLFGEIVQHDTDVYAFWDSSQKADPGLNITGYTNKTVDALLEKALVEPDQSKRFALYDQVSTQLAATAPVVFLYTPDFTYLLSASVQNAAIPPITQSSDRFSLVYQWYIRTDRVWKFFENRD
jgi:peptide/nickel transport system substrate-binding protein